MFQVKVVEKNKTFLCSITFFLYSCRLWDNVEKHGGVRQATDGSILRRIYIARWIIKATSARSECVILIAFPWQQRYVLCTLTPG